jgi:Zn-finger nucleic acid-binding protein
MTCPNCGAAMRLKSDVDSFVCDFCGAVHVPDTNADGVRVLGEESGANCPICRTPLLHAAVSGRRIQYCETCRGMLIPMGYFVELTQELRAARGATIASTRPADERDLDRRIDCPQCGARMDTHRYGGPGNVIIDSCERCQVNWLDFGELGRIAHAPDPAPPL